MNVDKIDRRAFIAKLGGAAALSSIPASVLADELEEEMIRVAQANPEPDPEPEPEPRPDRAAVRRGSGTIFDKKRITTLDEMPAEPTLIDFFNHRFLKGGAGVHCLRSAQHALDSGQDEIHIMAALLHDTVMSLMRADHGYWGADFVAPYVDERIAWGIRYHQALRFFPDESVGYEYPELYNRMFGENFDPEPYVHHAYKLAKNHKWYMHARMITVNDTYGFDDSVNPSLEDFTDIIGRNFKQPKEGLGKDASPSSHMWRVMVNPERPL